ncbi:MAG: segregation/condensation protein A [Thermogemmatispora sp.]|jgi:segregation and condensation protein A|uniref:segregation and condensation protein A n=1 Tax=Thermogemmatispora sp. TaxID=1968838 RepID=UPI0019E2C617|nr:segregation/condensation protein A [Thermogemmatispora sp.]MBE3566913.1 segregation/condensation protein A [Thermogemmatispora sp.]
MTQDKERNSQAQTAAISSLPLSHTAAPRPRHAQTPSQGEEPEQAGESEERATQFPLQGASELWGLPQTGYIVRLPVFEGPLELLLYLIEKRQMEITTISLVAVTDQYLAYLRRWHEEELPLANMAAFVAIAARLLFIKSQSLLPRNPRQEISEETRQAEEMAAELERHLKEYKIAKEIASVLRQRAEAGLQTYGRSSLLAGIEAQLAWTPPTLVGLEVEALARSFRRLLETRSRAEAEANGGLVLPVARVRVSERIAVITARLRTTSRLWLSDLLEPGASRLLIVVTFLAMLDLWKHERISVRQETLFGPILLERGPRWQENETEQEEATQMLAESD